jgi:uncharacterized protein
MGLQQTISDRLLEAMKSRDAVRTGTLRLLISAFRNEEIKRKKPLSDEELREVVQSEAKRRREAIEEYKKANREDLAAKEEGEFNVLQEYLPKQLSEAELSQLVEEAVKSTGAKGPRDMGRVMGALMPQIKGRADGRQAQQLVQKKLS